MTYWENHPFSFYRIIVKICQTMNPHSTDSEKSIYSYTFFKLIIYSPFWQLFQGTMYTFDHKILIQIFNSEHLIHHSSLHFLRNLYRFQPVSHFRCFHSHFPFFHYFLDLLCMVLIFMNHIDDSSYRTKTGIGK